MVEENVGRQLIVTEDGSHTLFVPELKEHYHSIHGAVQESMHVFIQTGFNAFVNTDKLRILEIGFGTGLNALLTYREAIYNNITVKYTSIEKYPITPSEIELLNYTNDFDASNKAAYESMHKAPWENFTSIAMPLEKGLMKTTFELKKVNCDLLDFVSQESFDLIYFDAFSPNVQPKLWSESVFMQMYNCLTENGVLVTYSAKGFVKRNLRAAGFKVKRLPGPPGKREMLRATKVIEETI